MSNQQLQDAYIDLLKTVDKSYLDIPDRRPSGLSGLFLPSVGDNYQAAKNKVMIVGSETAGWEPLVGNFQSTESYVAKTMQKHQNFFAEKLNKKTQDRGHTFHNFTRSVAKVAGKDGLIYSNLFCFDWRKSSPIGSPHFSFIKQLSKQLLDAQIKVLKPNYIIFANGMASAKYRREFFPVGDGERCSNPVSHTAISSTHYLWEFTLDENIRCFRVHHPSARRQEAKAGRAGAIELLARAVAS